MTDAAPLGAKIRAKRWVARAADRFGVGSRDAGIRVLNYHSIVERDRREAAQMTAPVALFREHLERLAANGYRVESASAVVRRLRCGGAVDSKSIVLTFDDGFADNYRVAFPVLCEFGVPATFFLITAALNGEPGRVHNRWVEEYLDWTQAREMLASGLVEFGCHTAAHRPLRGLPAQALREETDDARRELEDGLGCEVALFAYPFGSYGSWDGPAVAAVQHAGFLGAFTTVGGVNTLSTDPFLLKRTRVSWTDEDVEFDRLLRGAYDWYELVQRLQGWRARPGDPRSGSHDQVRA